MIHWDEVIKYQKPYEDGTKFSDYCAKGSEWYTNTKNGGGYAGMQSLVEMTPPAPEDSVTRIAWLSVGIWLSGGRQTYSLSPVMCDAFLNTSLENVSLGEVNTPHDCAFLEMPENVLMHHGESVRGIYIRNDNSGIQVVCWIPGNIENAWDKEQFLWMMIRSEHENEPLEVEGKLSLFRNGETCECCRAGRMMSNGFAPWEDESEDVGTKSVRIAINCILYMNSKSAAITTAERPNTRSTVRMQKKLEEATDPKKKRKYERKLLELPTRTVIKIGPAHLQGDTYSRPADERSGPRMHCRRGHWHRYRVGPKLNNDGTKIPNERREVRLNWVEPTWVGQSDNGVIESHIYRVNENN